jgi:transglutaminase-like putative cysteine protease
MKVEISYRVTLPKDIPSAALWIPVPAATEYQRVTALRHKGDYAEAGVFTESVHGAPAVYARWPRTGENSSIQVTAVVESRDRDSALVPTAGSGGIPKAVEVFLAPSAHIPTDGIVRQRAEEITRGQTGAVERARAIYGWVIENTHRDFEVAWCGTGDVKAMLESGNLCGKCVDINSLLVALARAAGIPAREVFGIRAAPSRLGPTLGRAGDITNAQHCKGEVYLAGLGWRPLDPADVVKLTDEKQPPEVIERAREFFFGKAEGNWVAFNHGRDFLLEPPPANGPMNYFMYPYAESGGMPLVLRAGSPGYAISSTVLDTG